MMLFSERMNVVTLKILHLGYSFKKTGNTIERSSEYVFIFYSYIHILLAQSVKEGWKFHSPLFSFKMKRFVPFQARVQGPFWVSLKSQKTNSWLALSPFNTTCFYAAHVCFCTFTVVSFFQSLSLPWCHASYRWFHWHVLSRDDLVTTRGNRTRASVAVGCFHGCATMQNITFTSFYLSNVGLFCFRYSLVLKQRNLRFGAKENPFIREPCFESAIYN